MMRWGYTPVFLALGVWLGLGGIAAPAAPFAPSHLVPVAVSAEKVDLAWSDNSANEIAFRIERRITEGAWGQVGVVPANGTLFSDTWHLAAGTTYEYRVWATNAAGESASPILIVRLPDVPDEPANLGALGLPFRVFLEWDTVDGDVSGFEIYRKSGAEPAWRRIVGLATNVSAYTDDEALTGVTYDYKVRAYNQHGYSGFSGSASARPLDPPFPPGHLQAQATGRAVELGWLDQSDNETQFVVERKVGAGGTWALLATTAANVTNFNDRGLGTGDFYFYRVRARNADGDSDPSNEVAIEPLSMPRILPAIGVDTNRIDVFWEDFSVSEDGFLIARSTNAIDFSLVATQAMANATNYTDEAVISGEMYYYRVKAYNALAESSWSDTVAIRAPGPPKAPYGLEAWDVNDGSSMQLQWFDPADNEDAFIIEGRNDDEDFELIAIVEGSDALMHDVIFWDLEAWLWKKHYRVKATNAWGASDYDGPVEAQYLTGLRAAFLVDRTNTYTVQAVNFENLSMGLYDWWAFDYNNDGTYNASGNYWDLPSPVLYSTPGVRSVKLRVWNDLGQEDIRVYTNYITVSEPPPLPEPEFVAGPLTGLAPLLVTFTNQTTGVVVRTEWDFDGDGRVDALDASEIVQYTYNTPGTYSPMLRVHGLTGMASVVYADAITVTAAPPVAAFSVSETLGPIPFTVHFTDLGAGSITTRAWDFGDGTAWVTNPAGAVSHTYAEPGLYSVSFSVAGPLGVDVDTRLNFIRATPPPENYPPVVEVGAQQIFLTSLADQAVLDASPSFDPDGDRLLFSWRESPENPVRGLIPKDADSLSRLPLYCPKPGRYQFDVRVSDGREMSRETRTFSVYAPGLQGTAAFQYSGGLVRIPDARIAAYAFEEDAVNDVNVHDETVTDSRGRFVLENIGPYGPHSPRTWHLKVTGEGFASSDILPVVIASDPHFSTTNLYLSRGTLDFLRGTVTTTNGVPIGGVSVELVTGLSGDVLPAVTDADGRYELYQAPLGTWTMEFQADGYQPMARDVHVTAVLNEYNVHLLPARGVGRLNGRIRHTGTDRPVIGARIALGSSHDVYSDSRGRFRLDELPMGLYVMTVTKDGFETVRLPSVNVDAPSVDVDVPMNLALSGSVIQGTVLDAISREPVFGARVGIEGNAGLLIHADITDATGFFHLDGLPPGQHSLRVEAQGYHLLREPRSVDQPLLIALELARARTWRPSSVVATNQLEAAVAQEFIFLPGLQQSFMLDASASVGNDLSYIWREGFDNPRQNLLPAGSTSQAQIQMSVSRPGIYMYTLRVREQNQLSRNTTAVTVFAPGLAGHVHWSPSDRMMGVANAIVRAYTNRAEAAAWDDAGYVDEKLSGHDPAGDFVLNNVGTGRFWVAARNDAALPYGPVRRHVNSSSAARESDINLPRQAFAFDGLVLDAADLSTPIENVRIVVAPGSVVEMFRTSTDASGRFRLEAIPRGSHGVMLMKDGYYPKGEHVSFGADTSRTMTMQKRAADNATLRGRVTATFANIQFPLPNAEIAVGAGLARAFTDAEGFFSIAGLSPGLYTGLVRRDGYLPQPLALGGFLQLSAGENRRDYNLRFHDGRGPVVAGDVMDEAGNRQPGAAIRVIHDPRKSLRNALRDRTDDPTRPPDSIFPVAVSDAIGYPRVKQAHDETDAAGGFQLAGVPDGERVLEIELEDGRRFAQLVNVSGSTSTLIVVPLAANPYSVWVAHFFDDPESPDAAPDTDYDEDGLSNWAEFVLDMNPTNGMSSFLIPVEHVLLRNDGQGTIRLPGSSSARLYDIYWKTNLLDPVWTPMGMRRYGTGGDLTFNVTNFPGQNDAFFFRIGVDFP